MSLGMWKQEKQRNGEEGSILIAKEKKRYAKKRASKRTKAIVSSGFEVRKFTGKKKQSVEPQLSADHLELKQED